MSTTRRALRRLGAAVAAVGLVAAGQSAASAAPAGYTNGTFSAGSLSGATGPVLVRTNPSITAVAQGGTYEVALRVRFASTPVYGWKALRPLVQSYYVTEGGGANQDCASPPPSDPCRVVRRNYKAYRAADPATVALPVSSYPADPYEPLDSGTLSGEMEWHTYPDGVAAQRFTGGRYANWRYAGTDPDLDDPRWSIDASDRYGQSMLAFGAVFGRYKTPPKRFPMFKYGDGSWYLDEAHCLSFLNLSAPPASGPRRTTYLNCREQGVPGVLVFFPQTRNALVMGPSASPSDDLADEFFPRWCGPAVSACVTSGWGSNSSTTGWYEDAAFARTEHYERVRTERTWTVELVCGTTSEAVATRDRIGGPYSYSDSAVVGQNPPARPSAAIRISGTAGSQSARLLLAGSWAGPAVSITSACGTALAASTTTTVPPSSTTTSTTTSTTMVLPA